MIDIFRMAAVAMAISFAAMLLLVILDVAGGTL
jgi:hypothetical protein